MVRMTRRGFGVAVGTTLAAGCRRVHGGAPTLRAVSLTLPALPTVEGAGVRLTRAIGQPALRELDPFLLLDRFASGDPADYVRGFPDHPHRGFETVTIMLDGRFRHRDSRGNTGVITGGGAQWMTAARGIVHSEMPDQIEGLLSGFQLWVNLPAREKLSEPHYQDLPPASVATARLSAAGSDVRVIAGDIDGLRGPIRPRPTAPMLATVTLADDRPFAVSVPADHTAFVFVHEGAIHVGEESRATRVAAGTLAVLGPGTQIRLRARERRSGLLVAAARPLHEPVARRGPFVMNTEAELAQAFADYRAGTLTR